MLELELERLAVLPERLLLERLMVPPCALELLDDELIEEELREEPEDELLDALEEERLLLV